MLGDAGRPSSPSEDTLQELVSPRVASTARPAWQTEQVNSPQNNSCCPPSLSLFQDQQLDLSRETQRPFLESLWGSWEVRGSCLGRSQSPCSRPWVQVGQQPAPHPLAPTFG